MSTGRAAKANTQFKRIEWSDIWLADVSQHDLPSVLIIGDSIAQEYFRDVEKELTGRAYYSKYATSKFLGNPDYLIAVEYMTRHGIAVDDLYSLVADPPEYFSLPQDSTHFRPQGRAVEAKQMSEITHRSLTSEFALVSGARM